MTGKERNTIEKVAELLRVFLESGSNLTSTQAVVLDFVVSIMEILADGDDVQDEGRET